MSGSLGTNDKKQKCRRGAGRNKREIRGMQEGKKRLFQKSPPRKGPNKPISKLSKPKSANGKGNRVQKAEEPWPKWEKPQLLYGKIKVPMNVCHNLKQHQRRDPADQGGRSRLQGQRATEKEVARPKTRGTRRKGWWIKNGACANKNRGGRDGIKRGKVNNASKQLGDDTLGPTSLQDN